MLKKKKSRLVRSLAITLAVLLVVYIGLSAYGTKEALGIPRVALAYTGDALGVPYQDVAFPSRGDNVTLRGWFLPGPGSGVIAVIHGGFQPRIDDNVDTPGLARGLVGKGYSVLLYDLRGRGESDGEGQALSNIDPDIGGAVDYLEGRGYRANEICLLGFCSGAASACIYSSRNQVGAVVLDGCFSDVHTMVNRQAESVGIPAFLEDIFWPGALLFGRWLDGYQVVNPIDVVHNISCPVFFIHEANDEFITAAEVQALRAATANPADTYWEIASANHSQGYKTHPQEYLDRVDGFLTAAMPATP